MGGELIQSMWEFDRAKQSDVQDMLHSVKSKDDVNLIENSCIRCNKRLGKDEVKILPPSYVMYRDPYVRSGLVNRRLMCVKCYGTLRSSAVRKVRCARRNTNRGLVRSLMVKCLLSNHRG